MKPHRSLLAIHRFLGIVICLFIIILAVTGILLNHTSALRLDERLLQSSWLMQIYGIAEPQWNGTYTAGHHSISQWDEQIFLDQRRLNALNGKLRGMVSLPSMLAIALNEDLILLAEDGKLIDRINLPVPRPGNWRLGISGHRLVVETNGQFWISNEDISAFSMMPDGANVDWSLPARLSDSEIEAFTRTMTGPGLPVERMLLDIHSGRLFSRAGVLWMDAVGVMMVVLATTGVWVWWSRRRSLR